MMGLAIAACYFSIKLLLLTKFSIIALVFCAGVVTLFYMVLYFMLKFLNSKSSNSRVGFLEIKRQHEPNLFDLIEKISSEINSELPSKVYLTTEVNAYVFYESSFWSMLFPVKKNLVIGVGLINVLTKSELEAVLAHEFGHFSQSTMRVGSYVYNAQIIISNMLFENDEFNNTYEKWSGKFAFFPNLGRSIINSIKSGMSSLYKQMLENHSSLSREMEFHADAISASVTGFEPMVSALPRFDFASEALSSAMDFYIRREGESAYCLNLYEDQLNVMRFLAQRNKIEVINGIPQITSEFLKKNNYSKLSIQTKLDSHPTLEERIERLKLIGKSKNKYSNDPASEYFKDFTKLQKQFTKRFFEFNQSVEQRSIYTSEDFKIKFEDDYIKHQLPDIFNGYYDLRNCVKIDVDSISEVDASFSVSSLFSKEMVNASKACDALANDILVLEQIEKDDSDFNSIEYDGVKYGQGKINELLVDLRHKLEDENVNVVENDIRIFQSVLNLEKQTGHEPKIKKHYKDWISIENNSKKYHEIWMEMNAAFEFVSVQLQFYYIHQNLTAAKQSEVKFKSVIQEVLNGESYLAYITSEIRDKFNLYLSKEWEYFSDNSYIEANLEVLFHAIGSFFDLMSDASYRQRLVVLNLQAELFERAEN